MLCHIYRNCSVFYVDKIQTQFSGRTDPKSCAAKKLRPNHPRSTRPYQSHKLTSVTSPASTPLLPRPRMTEASRLTCYQPVNRTFTAPGKYLSQCQPPKSSWQHLSWTSAHSHRAPVSLGISQSTYLPAGKAYVLVQSGPEMKTVKLHIFGALECLGNAA